MFGFLKKIYNRKKSVPLENPELLGDQADKYSLSQKEEDTKELDPKTGKTEARTKRVRKNKIFKKEKLKPEHHEFISKLGRKSEPIDSVSDYGTKNISLDKKEAVHAVNKWPIWKKIICAALVVVFIFSVFYWILQTGFKRFEETTRKENETLISAIREVISQEIRELKEQKIKEAEDLARQKQEEEFVPAKLSVKVLNGGSAKGSAKRISELLIGQGYESAEFGNVEGPNVDLGAVYYKEDKFAESAQEISDFLSREEAIYTATSLAQSDEEKSADVVVVLGKSKGTLSPNPDEQTDQVADGAYNFGNSELGIKVISRGAPGGYAGEVRDALEKGGYEKAETGSSGGVGIIQTLIFYNGERFRLEAESVREFLIQKEEIYSALREASAAEEKSADIVIMLGKNKEAPPN